MWQYLLGNNKKDVKNKMIRMMVDLKNEVQ